MDNQELREIKERCLLELRAYLPTVKDRLERIDNRIYGYTIDAVREDMDTANVYELLGIRKVLRLMEAYEVNENRVRLELRAIEGEWENGKHVRGGLRYDTPRGHAYVRLMPYQVWCIFGIFAFMVDVDMQRDYTVDVELLPSEFVKDGRVYDKRRLCQEAHIFQTRKSGKTEFGASLDFTEANVLGDNNAQVLICANSREQAKIAFKAVKAFCYQIDPSATNKSGGKYLRVTADEMTWKEHLTRTAEIKVMSAGGKTKDGLYGSWVHADEHGSAGYVKGHSDMEDLVQVCVGSMGPRRERMLLHTTTAGLVNEGPYQVQLRTVERLLTYEMRIPLGEARRTDDDRWFAFLLRLDPWEITEDLDQLNKENLFRKVNRSIGVTVQPTWYHERLDEAKKKGGDVKREVLTKDFNIWQSKVVTEWVKPEHIRKLQRTMMRIDDCVADDGWRVFVGMDFSMGDDLHALTYLAFRETEEDGIEFFADMDSYISQETYHNSPLRYLYDEWIKAGWLHVSPGKVLQPELPVNRIAELCQEGVLFLGFGYDPYKAKTPINALSAWMVTMTDDIDSPKQYIIPIKQTFASYNPVVEELDYMLKAEPPLITFSRNPMWAWEFGNVTIALSNDGMENKKPVKRSESETCKVDNVQCLCSALMLYDRAEGMKSNS